MSDQLPQRRPGNEGWKGFSADPRKRTNATFRASDSDRAIAADLLGDAFAAGRLDHEEYDDRLTAAMNARQIGEFLPLLSDVYLPSGATSGTQKPATRSPQNQQGLRATINTWLVVALITNVVWLATCIGSGGFIYYWPIWAMIGVGIPVLIMLVFGRGPDDLKELPEE